MYQVFLRICRGKMASKVRDEREVIRSDERNSTPMEPGAFNLQRRIVIDVIYVENSVDFYAGQQETFSP